jgi:D-glycero-D-manno-heptose 1,7-bisphosphate phosphatase
MLFILDRDGTINADPKGYIRTPEDWHALPGSLEAIARWVHAGHDAVVLSNQSGIGRGYFNEHALHAVHNKMHRQLAEHGARLRGVYYCPHHPLDACLCRKPQTLLVERILQETGHRAEDSFFLGDRACDIEAARNSGCQAVLVRTGEGRITEAHYAEHGTEPLQVFDDLWAAAQALR